MGLHVVFTFLFNQHLPSKRSHFHHCEPQKKSFPAHLFETAPQVTFQDIADTF